MKTIFIGEHGVRAGWRFALYAVVLVWLTFPLDNRLLPYLIDVFHVNETGVGPRGLILGEIVNAIAVLAATGLLAAFERRRIDSYGLPVRLAFGALFWEGLAIGAIAAAAVALAMIRSGAMIVDGFALHGTHLLVESGLWLVGMLLVGLNEEYAFRGYPLQALWRGLGFWPAAILLSLLFGAAHLNKPDENFIDIANIVLLGLLLCFTVLRTGSLWLAAGFHVSFDFMQFFVIGTRNGGAQPSSHLFNVSFPGPAWANGGPLGTEASYFMLPAIALMAIYIALRFRKDTAPLTRGRIE